MTMQAHVAVSLLKVNLVDGEHLRQVALALAGAQQLGFQQARAGKTPARTCPALILDGRYFQFFNSCELQTVLRFSRCIKRKKRYYNSYFLHNN
jgi:hypothetical protein